MNDGQLTTITVEAVSKRGKQIIKELGNRWWLCRLDEGVPCFDGEGGLLIAPEGMSWHSAESRWVRASGWLTWNDKNLHPSAESILEFADTLPIVASGS